MSFVKISELQKVEQPVLTDVLPVVNDNITKSISLEQIVNIAKANITILSTKIVSSTSEVTDENVLYLIPSSGDNNNLYIEYLLINGKPEPIGSQEIDLTGYATINDVETMINTAITGALEGSY